MHPDGTGQTQLTALPGSGESGFNLLATSWGVIRDVQKPK